MNRGLHWHLEPLSCVFSWSVFVGQWQRIVLNRRTPFFEADAPLCSPDCGDVLIQPLLPWLIHRKPADLTPAPTLTLCPIAQFVTTLVPCGLAMRRTHTVCSPEGYICFCFFSHPPNADEMSLHGSPRKWQPSISTEGSPTRTPIQPCTQPCTDDESRSGLRVSCSLQQPKSINQSIN